MSDHHPRPRRPAIRCNADDLAANLRATYNHRMSWGERFVAWLNRHGW